MMTHTVLMMMIELIDLMGSLVCRVMNMDMDREGGIFV
jgi:hypothetical protein